MTQNYIYLSFDVSDDVSELVKKMEECVAEIREWMREKYAQT